MHCLKISGVLTSFAIEGNGLRMAIGVGKDILFANVQYDYQFTYFNNSLVYSFQKP